MRQRGVLERTSRVSMGNTNHPTRSTRQGVHKKRAAALLSALDVLTSYESYRLMRDAQGHGRARVGQLLEESVHALFATARVP